MKTSRGAAPRNLKGSPKEVPSKGSSVVFTVSGPTWSLQSSAFSRTLLLVSVAPTGTVQHSSIFYQRSGVTLDKSLGQIRPTDIDKQPFIIPEARLESPVHHN